MAWESLKAHGLPVPEHYDAPAVGAVEENARLKLQVVRLGEVAARVVRLRGRRWTSSATSSPGSTTSSGQHRRRLRLGASCTPNADGTWACPFRGETSTLSDERYRRMRAQVHNDAAGWDDPGVRAVAPTASPPTRTPIKGNFTHEELPPELGYALPIGLGHAGDYNGYTVSYREYMAATTTARR